jgi:hypothetical protein
MPSATSQKKRTLGETVNTWVQTVGIIIAAAWGFYTFFYKEIILPKSAPVNISLNLALKKTGVSPDKRDNLTAVEMKCSATNPSSREIHLLPSAWIAYGISIAATPGDDTAFMKNATARLKDQNEMATVQRHAKNQKRSVVATGNLFDDTGLKPGETTGRTIIFYVHQLDYDLVDVTTVMPSAADVSDIQLEWTLTEESELSPTVHRKGQSAPLDANYLVNHLDLQTARANAAISLWP